MSTSRPAPDGGTAFLEPVLQEGRQLDDAVRNPLETSLHAPFGDVVVHSGAESTRMADRLDAAAFTVGRHVVLGPSGQDLSSARGRMLLGHELAHVVQQRRSGGDPDLGVHSPAAALTRVGAAAEQSAHDAAPAAATGVGTTVGGSAPVGIAREDKKEERSWRDILKEKVRDKAKEALGSVEGVALEAGQIVDTVMWANSKLIDVGDAAIELGGKKLGASKEAIEVAKSLNSPNDKAWREEAKKRGMIDKDTGAPMVSGKITELADAADAGLDKHVFTGMKKDDSFFTPREVSQLETAIGVQVGLSLVGVEEVQLGLKVVSAVGVVKAVIDAIEHNPKGFAHDRNFWTAVANAVLHVVGLKSASSGKKIITLVVDVLSVTIASGNEIAQLMDDYGKPAGEERDKALRRDIQGLIKVVAGAVQQAISHHKSLKAAGAGGAEPDAGTSPAKPTGGSNDEPAATNRPATVPDDTAAAQPGNAAPSAAPTMDTPAAPTPAGPKPITATQDAAPATRPAAPDVAPAAQAVPAAPDASAGPTTTAARKQATPTAAKAVDQLEHTDTTTGDSPHPSPAVADTTPGAGHADPANRAPSTSTREAEGITAPVPTDTPSAAATAGPAPKPPAPKPVDGSAATPKPATPGPSNEAPSGAGTPAPQPEVLAKPATASKARESAEAGDRMTQAAARAKASADDGVIAARADLEKAKSDLAALPPVTEPVPSATSRKKLPEAEKNRRDAQRKVESAEKALKSAEDAATTAESKHQEAQQEALARRKILDAAEKATADRKAAAAARSDADSEGKRTREQWEKEDRPDQAKAAGARSGENLHHSIELQVLDIPEFAGAFSPAELRDAANIRLIPREVNAADQALLDTARRTPQASWPSEVSEAVTMAPSHGPNGTQQLPTLKDWTSSGRPAQLHQSKVRELWDGQYAKIKADLAVEQAHGRCLPGTPEHRAFVRARMEGSRDYIDWALGSFWGETKAAGGLR